MSAAVGRRAAGLGSVVVVGASAAGLTVAEGLRGEGFDGRITLIGAEPHLPYDRPPLSKQVLAGAWEPQRTLLRDDDALARLGLELRLGVAAGGLDLADRAVMLADGERVGYDALVIATGSAPRRLPSGRELPGVHVLRTLDDALALREELAAGSRLAVVGAGFLGCEVAATARGLGLEVTLIDPLAQPLLRQLGELVGRLIGELHRDHGVEVRTGVGVAGLLGDARVRGVELVDGTRVDADVVLVAIGAAPATAWLAGSGLALGDGVVCDATCRAAPGVYAAGDVARWQHPALDGSLRVEHRMNATEQGLCVARNLLGAAEPFAPVPYFWSDQYDVKLQAFGVLPAGAEPLVAEGSLERRRFVVHYVVGGRVAGVLAWDMPRELRAHRARVGLRGDLDREQFRSVPVS